MKELDDATHWDVELYEHLTSHEANERALLEKYQDCANGSSSRAFRYLCALIVEDEIRHHRIFAELAKALRHESDLEAGEPIVPRLGSWGSDAAEIADLTDELLSQEHADAKELRRLTKSLKNFKDDTMWQLLVRLMEMDTAKHIEILDFVKQHASRASK
jgi:predicted NACHT family NTPase